QTCVPGRRSRRSSDAALAGIRTADQTGARVLRACRLSVSCRAGEPASATNCGAVASGSAAGTRTAGMIVRKNMAELEKMRAAGLLVWKILEELRGMVGEGVSTYDLEVTAEKMMKDAGARPAFQGYSTPSVATKFPFVLCTSVND